MIRRGWYNKKIRGYIDHTKPAPKTIRSADINQSILTLMDESLDLNSRYKATQEVCTAIRKDRLDFSEHIEKLIHTDSIEDGSRDLVPGPYQEIQGIDDQEFNGAVGKVVIAAALNESSRQKTLDILFKFLQIENHYVQDFISRVLVKLSDTKETREIVFPKLVEIFTSNYRDDAEYIARRFDEIKSYKYSSAEQLLPYVFSEDKYERKMALIAFFKIKDLDQKLLISIISSALKDHEKVCVLTALEAANTLVVNQIDISDLRQDLVKSLTSKEELIRSIATKILLESIESTPGISDIMPDIVVLLKDKDDKIASNAMHILFYAGTHAGEKGIELQDYTWELVEALKKPELRFKAVEALIHLDLTREQMKRILETTRDNIEAAIAIRKLTEEVRREWEAAET